MDDEKKTEGEGENKENPPEKSPAEIMREMKKEFDAEIAKREAEITKLKAEHAQTIKDILTGKDKRGEREDLKRNHAANIAAKLTKYFGGKPQEE